MGWRNVQCVITLSPFELFAAAEHSDRFDGAVKKLRCLTERLDTEFAARHAKFDNVGIPGFWWVTVLTLGAAGPKNLPEKGKSMGVLGGWAGPRFHDGFQSRKRMVRAGGPLASARSGTRPRSDRHDFPQFAETKAIESRRRLGLGHWMPSRGQLGPRNAQSPRLPGQEGPLVSGPRSLRNPGFPAPGVCSPANSARFPYPLKTRKRAKIQHLLALITVGTPGATTPAWIWLIRLQLPGRSASSTSSENLVRT